MGDCLIPSELLQLLDRDVFPGEYWETLKCYLDNEMNASKTARDLFIHRTTFLKRIDRILSLIDLSTPDKRLYIRICIYLLETLGFISSKTFSKHRSFFFRPQYAAAVFFFIYGILCKNDVFFENVYISDGSRLFKFRVDSYPRLC